MLHAAAMLLGIFALGLLVIGVGVSPETPAAAGGVAIVVTLLAAHFGGTRDNAFAAPQLGLLGVARARDAIGGAFSTLRAAGAADVTLKPALVRVKVRTDDARAQAALADQLSAAAGAVVIDVDADGLLVHVLDEDAIDGGEIGGLEARVLSALGQRRGA